MTLRIDALPAPDADLRETIRFSASHDPTLQFRALWGAEYPARAMALWSGLTRSFKSGAAPPAENAEELLMGLSYDIAVGPYGQASGMQAPSFHRWLIDGLRRSLDPAGLPPDPTSMQSYYAARAGEYDAVYEKPERQADLRGIEQWLPATLRGRRILELACGTGYWTRFLAPVASSIVAIDSAEETLRIARRRVASPSVSFALGDAYAPPRHDGPFDAAFAGFWFSHVPRRRLSAFLAGLHAVLAPGATVVFLDNRFVPGSSTAVSEPDAQGDTYQTRTLQDGSTHRVLKNFPEEDELRALVANGVGDSARYTAWPHFWAFEYEVATSPTTTTCETPP